jgi:hypothetical protein
MLRPLLISCIVALCLVTHGCLSYGQERSVGPYFGASGCIGGESGPGWSVEAGMHFQPFYAGLEYGISYPVQTVDVELHSIGYIAPPGPVPNTTEQFWGVHAGYMFSNSKNHNTLYLGIVVLKSYQMWERYDSVSGSVTYTNSYLNVGPDVRYAGIDDGHIYLASAFTIRRGLKIGLGYMF